MHTVLDWRTFGGCYIFVEEENLKKSGDGGFRGCGNLDSGHCWHNLVPRIHRITFHPLDSIALARSHPLGIGPQSDVVHLAFGLFLHRM